MLHQLTNLCDQHFNLKLRWLRSHRLLQRLFQALRGFTPGAQNLSSSTPGQMPRLLFLLFDLAHPLQLNTPANGGASWRR